MGVSVMYAKTKKPPASENTSTVLSLFCSDVVMLDVLAAASLLLLLLLLLLLVPVLFVLLALRCKWCTAAPCGASAGASAAGAGAMPASGAGAARSMRRGASPDSTPAHATLPRRSAGAAAVEAASNSDTAASSHDAWRPERCRLKARRACEL